MSSKNPDPLKIKAQDLEDLRVVSSCVQDALVSKAEMVYEQKEKLFKIRLSRFRWENRQRKMTGLLPKERVESALIFNEVTAVQNTQGFEDPHEIHELLSLDFKENGKRKGIHLTFSGNHEIYLESDKISCSLTDMGDAWATHKRPKHKKI